MWSRLHFVCRLVCNEELQRGCCDQMLGVEFWGGRADPRVFVSELLTPDV
jgi:hypothetical protein